MPYNFNSENVDPSATSSRSATPVDSLPVQVLRPKELPVQPTHIELDACEDPKKMSFIHKWTIVSIISLSALCVTCNSGVAPFTENGIQRSFGISPEVSILSISLFSEGLGLGPLLLGPLSEFYGRNLVYWISYACFWLSTFPVAFAPNAPVHLVFRFWCGFAGSAFLSVAGGSISDLFTDATLATPMAVYTLCPFIGPVLGPAISGAINQHLDWRWTYYIELIWESAQFICLIVFVPETHVPTLLRRKISKLREATGDSSYGADSLAPRQGVFHAVVQSCVRPFQLIIHEQMILFLDLWNALILGILYLTFQAYPIIFENGHGYSMQSTGFTFLAIGLGMLISLGTQPYWNRLEACMSARCCGASPPELRLIMGQAGGILVPCALLIMAFTASPHITPALPILASIPFGTGIIYVFTSTFTYLVAAYRTYAASALASNAAFRLTFAAVFPLFAKQMCNRLGIEGALGLLAGLTALACPLPFIFAKVGERLRSKSRFAV
ncbi:MFS general substrate transporter [Neolentinus lepideus HHB14362 ss-1]|uniref:MFS general substrate transporter n=1 Tax=Neolentinus lepideus HHB14362 ss-1 TaxID=1314782 RepID=A0A165V857_9AGAM|nr:MFS general substrate transporter [Neolentinus lepideus HHB14362 ss-1]